MKKFGSVTVLLGAQWGDEGKGKVIDYLVSTKTVSVIARCQGGNNAGHTVVVGGRTYDFHILPSGVIDETCMNIIGNGVVVNLDAFFAELEHNQITKLPGWEKRIIISEQAHLIFDIHMLVDGQQEDLLKSGRIGTTNRGIGPTYSSKCFRNGIRIGELMGDFKSFKERYNSLVHHYMKRYPTIKVDAPAELERLKRHADKLKELGIVGDTVLLLNELLSQGKNVLVEGANGTFLDIDFGTYPYVTSSNASVGGAITGLGIPPMALGEVIGVVKAYQTRVGAGPFPTEMVGRYGELLQVRGKEIGVTTGRKRRCGYLDLFLLKRAHMINGFTALAVTKLDILDDFSELIVGVEYLLNGQKINSPPCCASDWKKLVVTTVSFTGWKMSTKDIRDFNLLPENCQKYLKYIEEYVNVPIKWIGVGTDRNALITR